MLRDIFSRIGRKDVRLRAKAINWVSLSYSNTLRPISDALRHNGCPTYPNTRSAPQRYYHSKYTDLRYSRYLLTWVEP